MGLHSQVFEEKLKYCTCFLNQLYYSQETTTQGQPLLYPKSCALGVSVRSFLHPFVLSTSPSIQSFFWTTLGEAGGIWVLYAVGYHQEGKNVNSL